MIQTLFIDSSLCFTELCSIGSNYGVDKSPYNIHGHRHPYTPVYNFLMAQYKTQSLRFAEIGVAGGGSVIMWNRYFNNGSFYFFDRDENFLNHAKELVPSNNTFIHMDVTKSDSIKSAFEKMDSQLDILIDDSSHNPDDQNRIIHEALPFIKSGGMIIIEDIERKEPESTYEKMIDTIKNEFSFISFIITEHKYKYSPGWDNDKLFVLIKK